MGVEVGMRAMQQGSRGCAGVGQWQQGRQRHAAGNKHGEKGGQGEGTGQLQHAAMQRGLYVRGRGRTDAAC